MIRHYRRFFGLVALVSLLCATGCGYYTTRTARQLDRKDHVVSVALQEPGTFVLPKLSGRWLYGLGWGDITAFGGTSYFVTDAGFGYRHYLSPLFNLDVDGRYLYAVPESWGMFNLYPEVDSNDAVLAGLTVSSSTTSTRKFYAGLRLRSAFEGLTAGQFGQFIEANSALLIGYEYGQYDRSIQWELLLSFLHYRDGEFSVAEPLASTSQIGFGVSHF